jgi:hypothetical protein
VFLQQVGSAGNIVHSGASRARNITTLFFMLGWNRYGFHKKRARTRYNELVFWHPVRSTGSVHSGASGVRNINALFFTLVTHYGELGFFHPVGSVGHVVHSGASGA